MAVILVGILTTKPLIFIKGREGGQSGSWVSRLEQGRVAQLVFYGL